MSNHLVHETSPYLLQHAANPVDWYPWGPEALRLAREQDKPILLSIGYSSCHWCHVMAHESFEDEAVAAVMNEHFINIKVDREERPDLDQIYQNAHYLLTRQGGGWPLNLFLTPDGTPFYSGTYFPKEARHGLPGFIELLQRVADAYRDKRGELAAQSRELIAALAAWRPERGGDIGLDAGPVEAALQQLDREFDRVHGGFGAAPKFMHPAELDLVLRQAHARQDQHLRYIALYSLQQMALGGLHDQLGGGFCRYSVDESWDIPHFEKMLYDNGLLLGLYSDAWLASGDPLFAYVAKQTAGWVLREMQASQGGYYASLDADSEHEEGKFYVWRREEVHELLSPEEYAVAAPYYGLDGAPNFEHRWHLRVTQPLSDIAQRLRLSMEQASQLIASAQAKLFAARERRIRPGRDEKMLGSWNGLMIAGMAKAARVFGRDDWLRSAQQAMDFVRGTLWQDGRLLATHKDGRTHLNAYLDDHAFLLRAALELLQAEFHKADLDFAIQLADALLQRFEDKENGGFFFTSHDHEALIQRNKTGYDDATPSGNGIAAQGLLRLAILTGDTRYAEAAERCLQLFFRGMQQAPGQFCSLCTALDELLQPPSLLVICGPEKETAAWQAAVSTRYLPASMSVVLKGDVTGLPPPLAKPGAAAVTAWLCRGTQCLPPVTRLDDLLSQLA